MLSYPIQLQEDDHGVMATSPDFPELTTFGDDQREALDRSVSALEEAVATCMHDNQDVPVPSDGEVCVVLPTLTAVKVILYQGMRDQNVGKSELGEYRKVWGNSGCHSGFGVGCQAGIPVFESVTQGAIERSCPGLKHEVGSLF